MTSWLQVPRKIIKSEEGPRVRNYFLTLDNGEFANYFVALFNARMFSLVNDRELYVYDRANPVSVSYALLEETFQPTKGVRYASEMMSGVTVLAGSSDPRYAGFLRQVQKDTLRSNARTLFQWSPKILDSIMNTVNSQDLPTEYDVGVHIRSRTRFDVIRPPSMAIYVSAVEDAVSTQKLDKPSVFVLVSDPADFIEFRNLAPKTWKLFQVSPATSTIRGMNVASYNRQNAAVKLNAYVEHLTELYCMQQCETIVGTLSSDVGRFLYLTAKAPETFKSLDLQTYS